MSVFKGSSLFSIYISLKGRSSCLFCFLLTSGAPYGANTHELRKRTVYLKRRHFRLALPVRALYRKIHSDTYPWKEMPLTGHFRANKNIAPVGGYLYTAVSPVVPWLTLMNGMRKEGEIPSSLSDLRIKPVWAPIGTMIHI